MSLLAALSLAATAAAASTPAAKPAALPPGGPAFEVALSEELLQSFLTAAAPWNEEVQEEVGALGLTHTVTLSVHLANPRVKVTRAGLNLTVDYTVKDASGLVDLSGRATPRLSLAVIPSRQVIQGTLTHSGVELPGGTELPLEGMAAPLEIPAVYAQTVELGDRVLPVEGHATEVLMEDGRVRLKGYAVLGKLKAR